MQIDLNSNDIQELFMTITIIIIIKQFLLPIDQIQSCVTCFSFCLHLQLYNKIAMRKQKPQIIHRQQTIHNPEFTPKIHAKKPVNFNRRPLAGQQSAYRPTRLPQRPLLSSEHGIIYLSEEMVRSSTIYRMLEQQMKVMVSRHQHQLTKLKQIKQQRGKQLSGVQRDQYNTKMQIWELKNEVMLLKQSIKEETQESSRLAAELGLEGQGDQNSSSFDD